MKAEGPCLECGRWVVFYGRQRCQRCNQRARRNTPPARCPRCAKIGMVWPEVNCCGRCAFVQWRRSSVNRARECLGCGEVKWICARDLCVACRQRDPHWPYRYAANLKSRLDETPAWIDAYVDYLSDRYASSGSLAHLRKLSAAISSTGSVRPDTVAEAMPAGAHRLVFGEFCASARIGFV